MFTGIIECLGELIDISKNGSIMTMLVESDISSQLSIDQSVSHNGVCLTVTNVNANTHSCQLVQETLDKSNFDSIIIGSKINLERAMLLNQRLDGHIVQGHVDTTTICTNIINHNGSWEFFFQIPKPYLNHLIPKGSITINGVSLTIASINRTEFSIAVIPYTYQHTNFKNMQIGNTVNLEFDLIGKYILNYMKNLNISE